MTMHMLFLLPIIWAGSTYVLWALYLMATNLDRAVHDGTLTAVGRALGAPIVAVAFVVDVLYNLIFGTVLYLALPRDVTLSQRAKRYYRQPGWRGNLSRWLGKHLLNPFDRTGDHLD